MTPQEPGPTRRVIRFASVRGHSTSASAVTLRPGLNVLVGGTEDDLQLLRSVFGALTGVAHSGLDASLEVDGTAVALREDFARSHGLEGWSPPVVEVPEGAAARSRGAEGSAGHEADRHMAEVAARERRLASDLELTRREIDRERELLEAAARGDGGHPEGGTDLHPADVAVMCDRLRELLAVEPPAATLEVAERLSELGRERVYRIHREEALAQLMEECREAIRSAREYLETPRAPDGDDGSENRSMADRMEAGSWEAHTIARLDLLEELAGFWRGCMEDLSATSSRGAELLAEANQILVAAGEVPSGSTRDAATRLRELAGRSGYDEAAVGDLVQALAGYVGLAPGEATPQDLLARAEERLARGAPPGHRDRAVGTWPMADPERLAELEATEQRLAAQLEAVSGELGALQRGREAARSQARGGVHDTGPNPFGSDVAGEDRAGPDGGWSLVDAVTSARRGPGGLTLPVLLVETRSAGTQSPRIDPLAVAALGIAGQIVWVTQRTEVLAELEALSDDVGIISA